jgi:hypothetical protein
VITLFLSLGVAMTRIEPIPTRSQKTWVVHEDNLVETLLASDRRLSRAEVAKLVNALEGSVRRKIIPEK